jgi:hypothetical protein
MHSSRFAIYARLMEGDAMRIGVATVLFDDEWQVESRNLHARLQLMGEILGAADRHRAALLVLPAGFFVVSREKDRDDIVKRARRSLSGTRTAVLWGVDVRIAGGIGKAGQRDRDPVLPFYLYLRDASGTLLLEDARQLAYCSTQAVSTARLPGNRVVTMAGRSIGVLACGELLARVHGRTRTMDYVRGIVSDASIVVDSAHADLKVRGIARWTRAVERCSNSRRSRVVVAQHLDRNRMHLKMYADHGAPPRIASRAATHAHQHREANPRFTLDIYEL